MDWLGIVLIIILGLVTLLLEFLVLPGGVVGIIGALFVGAGIVISYFEYGAVGGSITLAGTLIAVVIIMILIFRNKSWRKVMLHDNVTGKMNEIDMDKIQEGMSGIAVSRLAPAGKGKFGNEIEEVHSAHGFIDVGQEIIISKIEGNKIIVKLK